MRMCGAERRPKIRRERPSEHIPSRSFPSVARSCVKCSDAPCDDNGRRRQEFCSPSASSGVTLAGPRVRRAVSRACRHLVAVSRKPNKKAPPKSPTKKPHQKAPPKKKPPKSPTKKPHQKKTPESPTKKPHQKAPALDAKLVYGDDVVFERFRSAVISIN